MGSCFNTKTSTFLTKEILEELNKKGFVIRKKDKREFKIEKEYFTEREKINGRQLLSKIKCPVLIIHSDKDERVPVNDSKVSMQFLPKSSRLEIVEGGNHKFEGKENEVISLSLEWFKKHLPQ